MLVDYLNLHCDGDDPDFWAVFASQWGGIWHRAGPVGRWKVMQKNTDEIYWGKTSKLMMLMMALWVFFGFIVHMFVVQLNSINILGFPLGFYMAAQGSLIVFVVALFWFAKAQDSIDRECGVAEEE
jgi:putative solute:sodium symporter small subunit